MKSIITKNRQISSIIILIIIAFCYQTGHADVAQIVITDKDTYNYGEKINVNFSNATGNEGDWICIVPVGSPDTEAGDYKNMPKGLGKGSVIFDSPSPGKYEVRAYYNYSRNGYVVSARHSFLVKSSPGYERETALQMERMQRKINPNNPLEANLLPGEGLVYICREPWALSALVDVQIKVNGKSVVIMPNASYFLFSAPAGDINFSTGTLTAPMIGQEERQLSILHVGEATIKVKPSYVYYLKVKVINMSFFNYGTYMENVPHQEGDNLIDNYKLTILKL